MKIEFKTKTCPFCAEEIRADAIKCKHCGEFLDGSRPPQTTPAASGHNDSAATQPQKPTEPLKNPGVAAVLSFFVPGLGQIYNGQIGMGITLFILTVVLYFTIVLGILLHLYLVFDGYTTAVKINERKAQNFALVN
ncbi:MAG: hypothetical protein WA117_21280 [Verrucomicrobiia bacterium]